MSDLSFNFDGETSSNFGIIVKDVRRQLLPGSNHKLLKVPGRAESYVMPRELRDREIRIDCIITSNSLTGLQQKVLDTAEWLQKNEYKILSFSDQPDRYYRAILVEPVDMKQIVSIGQFTLHFVAEPLAYAAEETVDFVNDTIIINNQGTYKSQPSFSVEFITDASEWKITGPDNNYIRVVHNFEAGDKLKINSGSIWINGNNALSKLDWQNSRFFPLRVGENNLFILPTNVCKTNISWVPKYL
ncbi:MAG: phage tail family protein [Bacteroidales bacterium]|nr:phage tail family protein [Bacteroidales bacterium]